MNFPFRSAILSDIKMITVVVLITFLQFVQNGSAAANPDTTWSVSFHLNMTKAVNDQVFSPDSDYIYLVMDHGIDPLRLVEGPEYTYTAFLFDALDSGVTYNYKFRINDSVWENVNRNLTAKPGLVDVTAWWNNEPLNITTFIVNMKYAVQYGMFNPAIDSVRIFGTMNNFQGSSKMNRVDTTLNYSWTDTLLTPGSVHQYKYMINQGDSTKGEVELLYKPNRMVRIPDTLLTISSDYNNFNPAKRLMTFQCDMGYYVKAHHFFPLSDYLDIAGNFNGNGANDVLFDTDADTIYTLELFMDTAWIQQGPLSFRFRINGSDGSAELQGKPDRTYALHDTINLNPNIYTCFYNNLNPAVSTPPRAYNMSIQGLLIYKKILCGNYSYENVNGIPEGVSTYRWLRATNSSGTDGIAIDSANKITYVVDTLDIGKWLVFEVTPHAASGDSAIGAPVRIVASNSISAWDVGMDDRALLITRAFPNPAADFINVIASGKVDRIELVNYLNQVVLIKTDISTSSSRLDLSGLPRGLYILKATAKSGAEGVVRIIKL